MDKVLLIAFLLFMNLIPTPAEEQVKETYKINGQIQYDDNPVEVIYLDENVEKPEVNIPQRKLTLPVGVLNITSNTNTPRSALARSVISRSSYADILPLSDSLVGSVGGFRYGTTWNEEISYANWESTTSAFIRYDFPKYFSLETSFMQSANRDIDNSYATARIIPEWRITDKLTLKGIWTDYVQTAKNKNEVTIVYTPSLKKYADSLKFELGVAQTYYANGNRSEGIKFSTGFKI